MEGAARAASAAEQAAPASPSASPSAGERLHQALVARLEDNPRFPRVREEVAQFLALESRPLLAAAEAAALLVRGASLGAAIGEGRPPAPFSLSLALHAVLDGLALQQAPASDGLALQQVPASADAGASASVQASPQIKAAPASQHDRVPLLPPPADQAERAAAAAVFASLSNSLGAGAGQDSGREGVDPRVVVKLAHVYGLRRGDLLPADGGDAEREEGGPLSAPPWLSPMGALEAYVDSLWKRRYFQPAVRLVLQFGLASYFEDERWQHLIACNQVMCPPSSRADLEPRQK